MKKRKINFVNNRDFYNAIVDYYKKCDEKNEVLPIPKYLLQCITEIVKRIGHKKNFRYYSYLDDMKNDAIISCVLALRKRMFNVDKYDNPFAYFTSCCHFSFIGGIKRENKQVSLQEKIYIVDRDSLLEMSGDEKNDDSIKSFIDEYYLRFKSYDANSKKNKKKNKNELDEEHIKNPPSEVRIFRIP